MNDRSHPVLDLFSGYGGFSLAFEAAGFRTIGFSEIDSYASAILAHRWPDVPNLGPVQSVTRDSVLERCGVSETELARLVITGGFPCQPHSMAGKRGASADERDLWPECRRVLRNLRPRFALFENVAGLFTSESGAFLNVVLSDLAEIRYACQWQVVSAADVGAPHRRDRVWLLCVDELAYGHGLGRAHGQTGVEPAEGRVDALGHAAASGDAGLADANCSRGAGEGREVAFWPAAHGLWPARPGERQHPWEPARVVGNADGGRCEQRDPSERSVPVADTAGGQAQPELGGDADGRPDGPHAAPAQVREAAQGGAVMWAVDLVHARFACRCGRFFGVEDYWDLPGNCVTCPACLSTASHDHTDVLGGGVSAEVTITVDHGTVLLDDDAWQDEVFDPWRGVARAIPVPPPTPIAEDAVNRVHRLKALGNGIVPACAYPFAVAIARQLGRTDAVL